MELHRIYIDKFKTVCLRCSAIADAERQENETARAETPFTSMSDPLEALRLQVLKSVKPKGPDQHSDNVTIQVQREDGEISESSQRMSPCKRHISDPNISYLFFLV